jgi:hypothetical protein
MPVQWLDNRNGLVVIDKAHQATGRLRLCGGLITATSAGLRIMPVRWLDNRNEPGLREFRAYLKEDYACAVAS